MENNDLNVQVMIIRHLQCRLECDTFTHTPKTWWMSSAKAARSSQMQQNNCTHKILLSLWGLYFNYLFPTNSALTRPSSQSEIANGLKMCRYMTWPEELNKRMAVRRSVASTPDTRVTPTAVRQAWYHRGFYLCICLFVAARWRFNEPSTEGGPGSRPTAAIVNRWDTEAAREPNKGKTTRRVHSLNMSAWREMTAKAHLRMKVMVWWGKSLQNFSCSAHKSHFNDRWNLSWAEKRHFIISLLFIKQQDPRSDSGGLTPPIQKWVILSMNRPARMKRKDWKTENMPHINVIF